MADDIVDLLKQGSSGCNCGAWSYSECGCNEAQWSEMYIDAAADEIERLRKLVSELLPFMINDMEEGLALGYSEEHKEDVPCPDCQWYKNSILWKQRLDSGEFIQYT